MAEHRKKNATTKKNQNGHQNSTMDLMDFEDDDGDRDDDDYDINRPITRSSGKLNNNPESSVIMDDSNSHQEKNNSEENIDDSDNGEDVEYDDDEDDDGGDDDDDFDGHETVKKSKKNTGDDHQSLNRKCKSNINIENLLSQNIEYENQSLYVMLLKRKHPIQSIIQDWLTGYTENSKLALIQFVQLLVNASSCKATVTETLMAMQQKDIDKMLVDKFELLDNGYPLIRTGKHWKKFIQNLAVFIHGLLEQSKETIICDGVLFEFIISQMISFSNSGIRPFRHTATFMALNLLTALNEHINCLSTTVRESMIGVEMQQIERNAQLKKFAEIHCMIDYLFRAIFLERYRDTCPEIRLICIKEISLWIRTSPNIFLSSGHLKYIGYTLTDAVYAVRFGCVQTLLQLYEHENCLQKLDKFSERFHTHLFSIMLNEKETGIVVVIIKILGIILKNISNVLTEQHCAIINRMVFVKNRKIAQASGEFLIQSIICQLLNKKNHLSGSGGVIETGQSHSSVCDSTDLLMKLMEFFYNSNLPNHLVYFVDSIIDDNCELIKTWPVFIDCLRLLLANTNRNNRATAADEYNPELLIIKCLLCSIHQYSTGELPKGRYSNSTTTTTTKTKGDKLNDTEKLTEYFIDVLPDLLRTYKLDVEKLTWLLKIPQYMNFNGLQIGTSQNLIQPLLQQMIELIDYHWNSMELLDVFSKSVQNLCNPNSSKFKWCTEFLIQLITQYFDEYNEAIQNWKISVSNSERGGGDQDNPDFAAATAAEPSKFILKLNRSTGIIKSLYKHNNLNEYNDEIFKNFYESIQEFLKRLCNETISMFPVETIANCIETCLLVFTWKLHELKSNVVSDGGMMPMTIEIEIDCQQLTKSINEFMNISFDLIQINDVVIQEMAFKAITEILKEFNKYKIDEKKYNPIMKPLRFSITSEHLTVLNDYIQKYVFIKLNDMSSNGNQLGINNEDDAADDRNANENIDVNINQCNNQNNVVAKDKRRLCLIEYCSLIANDYLVSAAAVNVFQHYITFQDEYGDIIKEFMKKLRLVNKLNCGLAMLLTLANQFTEMQTKQQQHHVSDGIINNKRKLKNLPEFIQLKQLAKRFAQTFPSNSTQSSEIITKLHQYGISFAVKNPQSTSSSVVMPLDNVVNEQQQEQPTPAYESYRHHPNILFLSILSEFSSKLIKADQKKILNYLEYVARSSCSSSSSANPPSIICQPYILYVNSLLSD